MSGSLLILLSFLVGLVVGYLSPASLVLENIIAGQYTLYMLMFLVGLSIGADKNSLNILKNFKLSILLLPALTIVGTFIGVSAAAPFLKELNLQDIWAIGAGYGYYSLSSIYISEIRTEALGTIALISNILREIFTLVFTPILARFFGKISPILSGGATSMDTTLPVITQYCGHEFALISVFHGTVLTIFVPFLVTFFLSL